MDKSIDYSQVDSAINGAGSDLSSKLDKSIIPQLEAILRELDGDVLNSERKLRKRALQLARMMCVKLEAPIDTILRLSWLEPAYDAALKVCLFPLTVVPHSRKYSGEISLYALVIEFVFGMIDTQSSSWS